MHEHSVKQLEKMKKVEAKNNSTKVDRIKNNEIFKKT